MKITIEFDPGELAKAAAGQSLGASVTADAGVQAAVATADGATDGGSAPSIGSATSATPTPGHDGAPPEVAAAAAAAGATSAGAAPKID